MILEIAAIALSLSTATFPELSRPVSSMDFSAPGPCLGEDSEEMQMLLPVLRDLWSWKGTRRAAMRRQAGVEHVTRLEDIQPVAVDSLCNHALGLIRQVLGEDAKKNAVALVRIGDRYVARYNYVETYHDAHRRTSTAFYFDEKFAQVKYLTW